MRPPSPDSACVLMERYLREAGGERAHRDTSGNVSFCGTEMHRMIHLNNDKTAC